MVINQGDIYWIDTSESSGAAPGLVIQNNLFNRSRIGTVVVCALTSNLKRAQAPGNVLLKSGEANLSKRTVVNVAQIFTVDKTDLTERIGNLTPKRLREVLDGIQLLAEPREVPNKFGSYE